MAAELLLFTRTAAFSRIPTRSLISIDDLIKNPQVIPMQAGIQLFNKFWMSVPTKTGYTGLSSLN